MPKDIIILCENIKKLRKKAKLSKKDMAKRLGIGTKSLTMLENCIIPKRLSAKIVLIISKEFSIPPENLFMPL